MKINESILYKCNFVEKNNIFTLTYQRYDYEFEGEIDVVVKIYKNEKNKFYTGNNIQITTLKELLKLDDNIQYNQKLSFVYLLKSKYGYKIGKSNQIHNRTRMFFLKLPFEFTVENFILTENADRLEKDFHTFFAKKNLNGEWFNLDEKDLLFFNLIKITLK